MEKFKKENGEVMLEGMIVMVITMFVMIWVLGVGFIYYQRYLVTAITNDVASKIAATYNNPDSDIMMGYISAEDISERDLYRNFNNNSLHSVNENKAEAYVKYILNKTNFSGTISDVDVDLRLVQDSPVRKHVEIDSICTFNTPFGEVFEIFGMSSKTTYVATGRADCTDIIDYYSTIDFASYQLGGNAVNSKIVKMLNSLIKLFNHNYAKT